MSEVTGFIYFLSGGGYSPVDFFAGINIAIIGTAIISAGAVIFGIKKIRQLVKG